MLIGPATGALVLRGPAIGPYLLIGPAAGTPIDPGLGAVEGASTHVVALAARRAIARPSHTRDRRTEIRERPVTIEAEGMWNLSQRRWEHAIGLARGAQLKVYAQFPRTLRERHLVEPAEQSALRRAGASSHQVRKFLTAHQ